MVVLESNLGYTQLHALLERAGDRARIAPEQAQRALKDMVFERWVAEGCEERTDTLKMVRVGGWVEGWVSGRGGGRGSSRTH